MLKHPVELRGSEDSLNNHYNLQSFDNNIYVYCFIQWFAHLFKVNHV